ncbi:MAG: DUF2934 domain-containing protein [Terriglobia bacterium]
MKSTEGTTPQPDKEAATPEIVTGEGLGNFASSIEDAIAHRAYGLFEARGYQHGQNLEDWFRAESELLYPLKVNSWESERAVVVTAEIPGFAAEEVKIGRLTPRPRGAFFEDLEPGDASPHALAIGHNGTDGMEPP